MYKNELTYQGWLNYYNNYFDKTKILLAIFSYHLSLTCTCIVIGGSGNIHRHLLKKEQSRQLSDIWKTFICDLNPFDLFEVCNSSITLCLTATENGSNWPATEFDTNLLSNQAPRH